MCSARTSQAERKARRANTTVSRHTKEGKQMDSQKAWKKTRERRGDEEGFLPRRRHRGGPSKKETMHDSLFLFGADLFDV